VPQLFVDTESQALGERFALIRTPRRRGVRYPAGCVTEVANEQAARQGADPGRHLYPALVYGPSRSSEGVRMFYLIRWLE
jgi:hypothetical protein